MRPFLHRPSCTSIIIIPQSLPTSSLAFACWLLLLFNGQRSSSAAVIDAKITRHHHHHHHVTRADIRPMMAPPPGANHSLERPHFTAVLPVEHHPPGECHPQRPCRDGVLLSVWTPQEVGTWTKAFRAGVYLLAMMYLFYGVSIVSDRFMAAIEVITSQEREVTLTKVTGERVTVLVRIWNETVSNLTLMALGSSAPEILLSVIEIIGNDFVAGDLGPSTIVGSAAFNLFIIIAVCIGVVPSDEVRRVKRADVFWVTVAWSTFAYVWLFLILSVISPGVVEVWEGVLTFLFFPLTVASAFMANKHAPAFGQRLVSANLRSFIRREPPTLGATNGSGSKRIPGSGSGGVGRGSVSNGTASWRERSKVRKPLIRSIKGEIDGNNKGDKLQQQQHVDLEAQQALDDQRRHYMEIFRQLRVEHPDLSLAELERLASGTVLDEAPKSRAFYRIQATHKMMGAGDLLSKTKRRLSAHQKQSGVDGGDDMQLMLPFMPDRPKRVSVGFDPPNYVCLENVGRVELWVVVDRGSLQVSTEVRVHYRTVADSAQEYEDFVPVSGELLFLPHESKKRVEVEIVDNDVYEDDEQFFVELYDLHAYCANNETQSLPAVLSETSSTATVLIIDDDHGGAFSFEQEVFRVSESQGQFVLDVRRHRGARGAVTLPYHTVDGAAKEGKDYVGHTKGELHFADGQTRAQIHIEILNNDDYEKAEDFYVELEEPVWHYVHDVRRVEHDAAAAGADGRPVLGAHRRCKVTITEDREFKGFVDRMFIQANTSLVVGSSSWRQQWRDAWEVEDIDGDGSISAKEKLLHCVSLPWKLIFALVPPTDYLNGWLCFCVAIVGIGVLTAIIGDVAAMFGCTVGLRDSVTAITLVAMGTSLPDTFASRTAAVQDKTADSSIGNVTGSNAVNVFLGIGVAWALAAIYHRWHGHSFEVEAGSLASSVTLFLLGSVVCLAMLQWRRYSANVGGELGGPTRYKLISICAFITVWVSYVLYSSLVAYCVVPGF